MKSAFVTRAFLQLHALATRVSGFPFSRAWHWFLIASAWHAWRAWHAWHAWRAFSIFHPLLKLPIFSRLALSTHLPVHGIS